MRAIYKLVACVVLRNTDNRHVKFAALNERLQRRENLLDRQIAGGAKKNERI